MKTSDDTPKTVNKKSKPIPSALRFVLDLGPLAVFFIGFRLHGLMLATAMLIGCTTLSLSYIYYRERKIAPLPLVTGLMVATLGGLTLALQNEQFIKMKPTFVNLLFCSVLLGGLAFKKPMLKWALGYAISLEDRGWFLLSLRWGLFFGFLALLNEYIWRNYPTDFWVNFKVFGVLSCTLVFTILQIPLMKRYLIEDTEKDKKSE